VRREWLVLVGALVAVQLASTLAPPPVDATQLAVSALVLFIAVAAAGARLERRAARAAARLTPSPAPR
jgi:hypothetical protein